MKAAEILRQLADLIDQNSGNNEPRATSAVDLVPVAVDNTDNTETSVMVPPLQVKLEILKKSEGIPNIYDNNNDEDIQLAAMKKNAGLTACQQTAAEDNDVFESHNKYEEIDVSLAKWRELILQRYPDAKIYQAPEEEGGTREAYVGDKFVGDWDGSGPPAGRIVVQGL